MTNQRPLSDDQLKRIAATLRRIRGGLGRFRETVPCEPAHVFEPEAYDDKHS